MRASALLLILGPCLMAGPPLHKPEPPPRLVLKGDGRPVVLSGDGKTLATVNVSTVELWDISTGKLRVSLKKYARHVGWLGLTEDGKTLAVSGFFWDRRDDDDWMGIKLRDLNTGKERFIPIPWDFKQSRHPVALSADGRTLAVGDWDGNIRLWDTITGKEKKSLMGDFDPDPAVALSTDGKWVAATSRGFPPDGTFPLRIWDTRTGRQLLAIPGRFWYGAVAVTPDGRTVIASDGHCQIRLWEVASGQTRATLRGHTRLIRLLSLAADGKLLASVGLDDTLRLWDLTTCKEVSTVELPKERTWSLALSGNGKTLALGCGKETLVWDVDQLLRRKVRR